ncbi:DUF3238 domain-containing protein [Ureibacillus sp. FSL E2-3493]|uniref:DUF3238 domain-containing protein n=1 Tax=Ureibacillus sp. FSL E2-3493 TaxID=2921367 RepID=UPI00311A8800
MKFKSSFKYLLAICLTILLSPSITTFAENHEIEDSDFSDFEVIKNGANEVIVNWKGLPNAQKYIVKYGDKIIYEGAETQFKDNNLLEGSINEYEIAAIDDKDLILSNAHLKIYTKLSNGEEIGIDTFSTSSSIILDWPDVGNIDQYTVYRDNQFIGTTEESNFEDFDLSNDTKYQYTITTEVPLSSNEIKILNEQVQDFQSFLTEDEEELSNLVELSTPVKTLGENTKSTTLTEFIVTPQISALAGVSKTWVKINTMILNTSSYPGYIKSPLPNSKYYYGTDKRTTITSQGSTRSSLEATINWSTLAVSQTKSIGWTNRYTKNSNGTYTFVDRKQASANNVYLGATKKTSSMVDINFIHSAKNPYHSTAPAIKYEFRSQIYKDGTTKIRGYHSLFPSLGIFRSDGSGYKTIYTHNQGNRGAWELLGHKTIDITK